LNIDNPSIRQAIFRMESRHEVAYQWPPLGLKGTQEANSWYERPVLHLSSETKEMAVRSTTAGRAALNMSDGARTRKELMHRRRKRLAKTLDEEILPAVSHARFLFETVLRWWHLHDERIGFKGNVDVAIVPTKVHRELAEVLSHVAGSLSLEASLLFASNEVVNLLNEMNASGCVASHSPRPAVLRWTQLFSWSCRYYSRAVLLRPNWAACFSNYAIVLYRLATMGELHTLLSMSDRELSDGLSGNDSSDEDSSSDGSNSSSSSSSSCDEDDEDKDMLASSSVSPTTTRATPTPPSATLPVAIVAEGQSQEDQLAAMQDEVNSRVHQLLRLALSNIDNARELSKDRSGSDCCDHLVAAQTFLKAELFLRTFVLSLEARVQESVHSEDVERAAYDSHVSHRAQENQLTEEQQETKRDEGKEIEIVVTADRSVELPVRTEAPSGSDNRKLDSENLSWHIVIPHSARHILDGLMSQYECEGEDRHLTVTGLANFTQDVVTGRHRARVGTTKGHNRDDQSARPELLRNCPLGTLNLAEQERLYEMCCARFGGRPSDYMSDTEEEGGVASVAEQFCALDNSSLSANGGASEISSRFNSDTFKRIVAYRAIHEPVPLWRLLQAQVKSLESLDRRMNENSSKSTRVLLATMHAAAKWQRFRSSRHFSVASGLADHPSLSAFSQIEMGQQLQLLNLGPILDIAGVKGKTQRTPAKDDTDIVSLELSSAGSGSPTIQSKPKRLAIRRDSRRMSVEGYFSDDELEGETYSQNSRPSSTASHTSGANTSDSTESIASRSSSSPSTDQTSDKDGRDVASTKGQKDSAGKKIWGKVRKLLYKKATKMLWTVRCVDYMVMFGAGSPTPQSIRSSKVPEDLEVEPVLFDSVPRAPGHPDMPIPPELATFCCPNGMKLRTFKNKPNGEPDIQPPTHFAQVLAVGTVGTTVYCYCLHFYDKLEPLELLSMFAGQNRAASGSSSSSSSADRCYGWLRNSHRLMKT
jgi:hypothetical protein